MIVVKKIAELRKLVKAEKKDGKIIGFVPTMGYLHDGHKSLMIEAKDNCDIVVVSIFVNPTQFGEGEDLESYPRDLDRDREICRGAGVDIIFSPEVDDMYDGNYSTYVECHGGITKTLCGAYRDGHFRGVTSVVAKLFNIVSPDKAYFGQKDAQQVAVIEKMVRELNFDIEVVPCPIVREEDGLALSSRNTYLTEDERQEALVLSQSLKKAKELIEFGEKSAKIVVEEMMKIIDKAKSSEIDYIQIVDAKTLVDLDEINGEILIAMAVKIGKPRLIDNMRMVVK